MVSPDSAVFRVVKFATKFAMPEVAATVKGPPLSTAPPGSLRRAIDTLPVNWVAVAVLVLGDDTQAEIGIGHHVGRRLD